MSKSDVQRPESNVERRAPGLKPTSECGPWTLDGMRRGPSGLTLIEVMLALAILGLGLSVLISSASRCLGVVRRARNYETARLLLGRVEVEHPLALEEKIQPGTEEGTFLAPYAGYRWSRTVEIVGKEEDGLFSVRTVVSWSDAGRASSEELFTYLYSPKSAKKGSF